MKVFSLAFVVKPYVLADKRLRFAGQKVTFREAKRYLLQDGEFPAVGYGEEEGWRELLSASEK